MRRAFLVALLAAAVGTAGVAAAHEGHEHKIMGKVVAVDEKQIEVETTEGKKVTGLLSQGTKYLRGKAPAARTDVKVGERVVIVVVEEQKKQTVKQVLLGTTAAEEHKH
jgi:hypothetical protein